MPFVNQERLLPGGVRHDPQRFMGKTVYVPHFNRDTVEFASRVRDGWKRAIWRIFKISYWPYLLAIGFIW